MQWISVDEQLPEEWTRVLIACEEGVCCGWFSYDQDEVTTLQIDSDGVCQSHSLKRHNQSTTWQIDPVGSYASDGLVFHVTHWAELPNPPQPTKE